MQSRTCGSLTAIQPKSAPCLAKPRYLHALLDGVERQCGHLGTDPGQRPATHVIMHGVIVWRDKPGDQGPGRPPVNNVVVDCELNGCGWGDLYHARDDACVA